MPETDDRASFFTLEIGDARRLPLAEKAIQDKLADEAVDDRH